MNASERVLAAFARVEETERPELWITLRPLEEVLADGDAIERRVADGEPLPLAGLTLAVKDNIDVAGLPTTAGCPAYAYRAQRTAPAVARLVDAGAIVLGKTNLDQFATGLAGTRTPHGPVRDARRPEYVSGGSSSGSAVAVALGIADIGLATDTAGSGRVPAAFQGLFGVKPTRGLVSTEGVIPACRSLDCLAAFTADLPLAREVLARLAVPGDRPWPADAPLAAPPRACIGIPDELPGLTDAARAQFESAADRLRAAGHELIEFHLEPLLRCGRMLYDGAFVSERYAAVGGFIEQHPSKVEETVQKIVLSAGAIPAHALAADTARLVQLRAEVESIMDGLHALLLPTTVAQPTIEEALADPIDVNARLGLYTNCVNLLDLCAVAVPAGEADGGQFGVTLLGRAFGDALIAGLAADLVEVPRGPVDLGAPARELFVVGAHRDGQPLNPQLTDRGGRWLATTETAAEYRMYRLDTHPPKPGLVRVGEDGASIEGELWALPPAQFADFVSALPAPMALGRVRLADGRERIGFLCEPVAVDGAEDITSYRSWVDYLQPASAA